MGAKGYLAMCLTLIWSRSRGGAIAVALFALAQTSSSWAQTNATRLAESVATPPSQTAPSPHTQLGAPFLADTAPSSTNAAGENSQLPSFTLPSLKDWAPTIGAIIAALITFVGVIYTVNRSVASSGFQRANEAEIKDIDAKLHVYGRLIHLLARDHMFAQDLRERQRKKDKNYRMLVYLFNEEWRRSLSDWDSALVEEVCGAAAGIAAAGRLGSAANAARVSLKQIVASASGFVRSQQLSVRRPRFSA
jgi:hypothetical protein